MGKKTYFVIALDWDGLFITESIAELKMEIKKEEYDPECVCYAVQVEDYQTLDLSFGELYVLDKDWIWDYAAEVISEDNYCLLDKGYILACNK